MPFGSNTFLIPFIISSELFINFAAMSDSDNVNGFRIIVNGIDDSVIADSDSPEVGKALKFLQPEGRGSSDKFSIFVKILLRSCLKTRT